MKLPSLTRKHTDPLSVLQAQTVGMVSAYHQGKLSDDELTVAIGEELEKAQTALGKAVNRADNATELPEGRGVEYSTGWLDCNVALIANLLRELKIDGAGDGRKEDNHERE